MDQNETLRRLRRWAAETQSPAGFEVSGNVSAVEAAELFTALDEWLAQSGFLPDRWAPATKAQPLVLKQQAAPRCAGVAIGGVPCNGAPDFAAILITRDGQVSGQVSPVCAAHAEYEREWRKAANMISLVGRIERIA